MLLAERLRARGPTMAGFSEENTGRSRRAHGQGRRTFVLDPIDGTRAYDRRRRDSPSASASLKHGRASPARSINPIHGRDVPGRHRRARPCNGAAIHAGARRSRRRAHQDGEARLPESRSRCQPPWPETRRSARVQADRLRVSPAWQSGRFDATILYGPKSEWDIAAGRRHHRGGGRALPIPRGDPIVFNQRVPRAPGAVAAGAKIHPLIIERTKHFPRPGP